MIFEFFQLDGIFHTIQYFLEIMQQLWDFQYRYDHEKEVRIQRTCQEMNH